MIIDGVLVGVGLAGLELGVAWILACVINHEPASEKKEEGDPSLKFSTGFVNLVNIK
ncbi:hypothetical protein RVIR1_00730 [Candidatus Rickettsiella viridis]|uniref:Uncharacterized protein n=1 Tax=Candidatus Rickettsiella viridis TaxID=676208 RepID=A0A2Z5UU89_9COXI|nr:hypothetical protein [Candidatus Rickettsiella viridis]BBB14615.1 hypothetical protein RVIR1_00730 [Candidatus Rickettsiella viridis]